MGLLTADLRALGNVLHRTSGRRLLVGHGTAVTALALVSLLIGLAMLSDPQLLELLLGRGKSLHTLLGFALLPGPIVTGWLGLGLAQRLLFESPELPLWLSAPGRSLRAPVQVLLRVLFTSMLWASALGGPFAVLVLKGAGATALAYAMLPVALLLVVLPPLCSLMAVQLLLVRWCAGRWLQITFTVLTAAASLGFSLFLMLGVFAQPEAQVERLLRATQDQHAPLARVLQSVAAGAELLGSSLGQPPDLDALRRGLLWLLSTLAAFLLTCRLHPRAVEAYQRAQRPLFARRRSRWPAGIAASLRKKELAQLLQQPAQLIGMLVFGVTVFVLAQQRAFVGGTLATDTLPAPIGQCFSMLSLWFLTVLMVLFAHMGRLAMWDGPQWPLYLKSPAAPGALLRGKLQAIWLLLLWPVLVVSLVGGHELHANLATQLVFAAIALGGNCLAIGVAAAVGTLPLLMRPDVSGQITPGSKSLGAAMLLVFGFELTVAPVLLLWHLLQNHVQHYGLPTASWEPWVPWTVAGVWGYALLVCGLGCWLGARNFARLLRPR